MHRFGRTVGPVMVTVAVFGLAACGSSSEQGIEKLIESQSGEDVDIDLGDGSFSVESEDGTFSVDEDGNFVIEGPDGSTVVGQSDGDGNFTMEGDDGSFSVNSGDEIPSEWPSEVPVPDDFEVGSASVIQSPDGSMITVGGTSSLDNEAFVAAYGAALEGAGFNKLGEFSGGGSSSANYEGGEWSVAVAASPGTDNNISVSVFPKN